MIVAIRVFLLRMGTVKNSKYRLVASGVSHMGARDSNSKWFDLALKAFQQRYPNVKAEYWCTDEYSMPRYIQLIERAISTKPDGLVVAVTDAAILDDVLRQAINQGIPVIAFNAPDLREPAARIPYRTFVGTDYYQDGKEGGRTRAGTCPSRRNSDAQTGSLHQC
jgi:simple sugar transport system substrate-binding protein